MGSGLSWGSSSEPHLCCSNVFSYGTPGWGHHSRYYGHIPSVVRDEWVWQ